ncbi:unnamed protein product, partial [marine sediment metagenome]
EEFRETLDYRKLNDAANRAASLEEAKLRASSSGEKFLAMPQDVRDNLVTGNSGVEVLRNMRTALDDPDFNPGSTGIPGGRTVANLAAQYGVGTDHSLEAQDFWREYNRRFNLLKRNELFGATLTTNEQRSWKSAVAGEEMNKEQLKSIIGSMARWEGRELTNYAAAMKAQNRYSPTAIDHLTPGLGGAGPEPEPAPIPAGEPTAPEASGWDTAPGGAKFRVIP